jgi:lipoprotein NlpI
VFKPTPKGTKLTLKDIEKLAQRHPKFEQVWLGLIDWKENPKDATETLRKALVFLKIK